MIMQNSVRLCLSPIFAKPLTLSMPSRGAPLEDFPAHPQAVSADMTGLRGDEHSLLIWPFPAEGTRHRDAPLLYLSKRAGRCPAVRPALRRLDARVADENVRSGYELRHFARWTPAPGADSISPDIARAPNPAPPTASGSTDDLLDSLMAERQCLRDFTQGSAGKVEPSDRRVVFRTGHECLPLGFFELGARRSRLLKKFGIEHHWQHPIV